MLLLKLEGMIMAGYTVVLVLMLEVIILKEFNKEFYMELVI